jgi:hypothetical protein
MFGLVGFSFRASTGQEKPTYKPTGSEATLAGTISFVGTPPEPKRIDMSADPADISGLVSEDGHIELRLQYRGNFKDAPPVFMRGSVTNIENGALEEH